MIADAGATPAFKGYHGYPGDDLLVDQRGSDSRDSVAAAGAAAKATSFRSMSGRRSTGTSATARSRCRSAQVSEEAATLLRVTEESLYKAIDVVKPGGRVSDIGHAVQQHVEAYGFSVVREFVGHGIGQRMHEEPQVPNYGEAGRGPRLAEGMVLAIEPMVNAGKPAVKVLVGRLDGGHARPQPVGALRAHGGGDGGRSMDSDGERSSGRRAAVTGSRRRAAAAGALSRAARRGTAW